MKKLLIILAVAGMVLLFSQTGVRAETGLSGTPPVSQALVREGDFAVKLARELRVGSAGDEAVAESDLSAVGVAPDYGWLSDYPVTPVVMGELQSAIEDAAASGRLSMARGEASDALTRVASALGLPIRPNDDSYAANRLTEPDEYTDRSSVEDYYNEEGPPVVSYYSPPWDYDYLYSWVAYPFWYSGFFFPGFFILNDFDVDVHHFGHHHDRFDHGGDHFRHISNHVSDRNGHSSRIDPSTLNHRGITNARINGGTGRSGNLGTGNMAGARSIYSRDAEKGTSFSHNPANGTGTNGVRSFSSGRSFGSGSSMTGSAGPTTRGFDGSRSFGGNQTLQRGSGFSGGSHFGSFSSSGGFSGISHGGGFGGGGHGGGFGGGGHGGGGGRGR